MVFYAQSTSTVISGRAQKQAKIRNNSVKRIPSSSHILQTTEQMKFKKYSKKKRRRKTKQKQAGIQNNCVNRIPSSSPVLQTTEQMNYKKKNINKKRRKENNEKK